MFLRMRGGWVYPFSFTPRAHLGRKNPPLLPGMPEVHRAGFERRVGLTNTSDGVWLTYVTRRHSFQSPPARAGWISTNGHGFATLGPCSDPCPYSWLLCCPCLRVCPSRRKTPMGRRSSPVRGRRRLRTR